MPTQLSFWHEENVDLKCYNPRLSLKEKMAVYGEDKLDLYQLLLILTGTTRKKALLSLSTLNINQLANMTIEEYIRHGLTKTAAVKLVAAFELAKRLKKDANHYTPIISQPLDAVNLIKEGMEALEKEQINIIILNTKNRVIGIKEAVAIGTLNTCIIHPRDIFKEAIKKNAAAIIVAHNHPSGDPTPSSQDIDIAEKLKKAGELLDIKLLDFIVIGIGKYKSLKEDGIL